MRIEIENETKLKDPVVTLRLVQSGTSINSISGNSVLLQGTINRADWFNIVVIDQKGIKRVSNGSIRNVLGFCVNGSKQICIE